MSLMHTVLLFCGLAAACVIPQLIVFRKSLFNWRSLKTSGTPCITPSSPAFSIEKSGTITVLCHDCRALLNHGSNSYVGQGRCDLCLERGLNTIRNSLMLPPLPRLTGVQGRVGGLGIQGMQGITSHETPETGSQEGAFPYTVPETPSQESLIRRNTYWDRMLDPDNEV